MREGRINRERVALGAAFDKQKHSGDSARDLRRDSFLFFFFFLPYGYSTNRARYRKVPCTSYVSIDKQKRSVSMTIRRLFFVSMRLVVETTNRKEEVNQELTSTACTIEFEIPRNEIYFYCNEL